MLRLDARQDRLEILLLEKGDQRVRVDLAPGEIGERMLDRHVVAQLYELQRDARHLGIVDQGLAPLRLLDLAGAAEQRLQITDTRSAAAPPS